MDEDCKLLRFECWEFVGVRLSEWKEDSKLALEISVDGDPKDIRLKKRMSKGKVGKVYLLFCTDMRRILLSSSDLPKMLLPPPMLLAEIRELGPLKTEVILLKSLSLACSRSVSFTAPCFVCPLPV